MRPQAIFALVAALLAVATTGWLWAARSPVAPAPSEAALTASLPETNPTPETWTLEPSDLRSLAERAVGSARSAFLTPEEEAALYGTRVGLPRLTGTLVSDTRKVAFLDGRPRLEGEPFEQFQVERIEAQSVVLRDADQLIELHVSPAPPPADPEGAR